MQGGFDELQQMASMNMMLSIMKTCFNDCVTNFKQEALNAGEKTCLQNCTKRQGQTYEILAQAQGQMGGGGKPFSPRDRSSFLDGMERVVQAIRRSR